VSFQTLTKNQEILNFVKEKGFTRPTAVQEKAIPFFKNNHFCRLQAATGSGKTLAYALPVVELIKAMEESVNDRDASSPLAIITLPTKELCQQVEKVFKELAHHVKLRIRSLKNNQEGNLKIYKDHYEVLITTSGKLAEAVTRKKVHLDFCQFWVLDEADTLFGEGFYEELETVYEKLKKHKHSVYLVSATESAFYQVKSTELFAPQEFQLLSIGVDKSRRAKLETFNLFISDNEKKLFLRKLIIANQKLKGLVFCRFKDGVDALFDELAGDAVLSKGVTFYKLHGKMNPYERKQSLEAFRRDKSALLIATDMAARGLDITDLFWIINYDLPSDPTFYIHRCGRVARLEQVGRVYNLINGHDQKFLSEINDVIMSQTALSLARIRSDKKIEEARKDKDNQERKESRIKSSQSGGRPKVRMMKKTPRFAKAKKVAKTGAKKTR